MSNLIVSESELARFDRAVVILSGGFDSTTALALAIETLGPNKVEAVSFDYGQRHRDKELRSATRIASGLYGIRYSNILLNMPLNETTAGSLLTDEAIPEKSYTEQIKEGKEKLDTEVPLRNPYFAISTAMRSYVAGKKTAVVLGVHKGDADATYVDCSFSAMDKLADLISQCTHGHVSLCTPFVFMDKSSIASLAYALKAPVGFSWSCYAGGDEPCGRCGTCIERKEALAKAGLREEPGFPFLMKAKAHVEETEEDDDED